jgi:hypothetical protein
MATEITAKGDLIVGTGNATFDNLPAGTNGYTLVADSVETTGLKWVAPSSGALTLISTQTMSATATLNINNCFSASYINYKIIINNTSASVGDYMNLKLRVSGSDSSTNYYGWLQRNFSDNASQPTQTGNVNNGSQFEITGFSTNCNAVIEILNPFTAAPTGLSSVSNMYDSGNTRNISQTAQSQHSAATSYDGFSLIPASGTLTGTVYIYGYGV